MSDNRGTRVSHKPDMASWERFDALATCKAIDRSNRYRQSERGFNTSMRVASDRPSKVERWSPGMTVGYQRTTYGAETSAKAYAHAVADSEWHRRKRQQEIEADAKRKAKAIRYDVVIVPKGISVEQALFGAR